MGSSLEFIETWFDRVWRQEDPAAIEELFIPDGEARGLGANTLVGPKDFKQFHTTLLGILSDVVITVDKCIEVGEWASAVCTVQAKSRKTGEPVTMTGSVMTRIVDGKLIESYNHWDFLGMFGQLGLLPRESFEKALSGEKVI